MDTASIVALTSTGVAALIAVTVPWVTFRLTSHQEHTRWLREQRAQPYVDLLTEAYAERQYFDFRMADVQTKDDETRGRVRASFVDLRLPPLERARLGARGTMFASRTVNRLFNRMQTEAISAELGPQRDLQTAAMVGRMHMAGTAEELEAAIRGEMLSDGL